MAIINLRRFFAVPAAGIGVWLWLALGWVGCGSGVQATDADATLGVSVAKVLAGDVSIEIRTDRRLEVGMTPIHLAVRSGHGTLLTDAVIAFQPFLETGAGSAQAAPVAIPPQLGSDGLYHGVIVFQTASGPLDRWRAKVTLARPGRADEVASFPSLHVAETGRAKIFKFTHPTTGTPTGYILSLNFSATPTVGLNPVVLTLHTLANETTPVPVEDAHLTLISQMPSMGHGAPGSVNPVLVAPGIYEGKLAFSMPGIWETTIAVERNGIGHLGSVRIQTDF